jgi:membrane-associated phospholipid phosphatase
LATVDARVVRWVRELPHPLLIDAAMVALSRVTDHSAGWLGVGLAGAAMDEQRRGRWLLATGRIVATELAVRGVKRLVPRDRPALAGLPPLAPTPSPRSFPSSHTAAAVTAVRAFDGLIPRAVLRILAMTTAFSRLYLGVHYPSDIAAGAMLGRVLSLATIRPGAIAGRER